jgi:hypothetical protein
MKKYFLLIVILIFTIGCATGLKRIGYQVGNSNAPGDCKIILREYYRPDSSEGRLVGKLNLYDNGFSTNCSEEDIINIIKKEGCGLNADIASLRNIKRPDHWSTCYRTDVEFYKLNATVNKDTVQKNEKFDEPKIVERVHKDNANQEIIMLSAMLSGLLAGILVFSITSH